MTVATRMFPPGPYWVHDEPGQCSPDWTRSPENKLGRASTGNVTSNVLFKVDLAALSQGNYPAAFQYVTHLTNPELGENRDVMLFPEKMRIQGREMYVALIRPQDPAAYPPELKGLKPSIFLRAAGRLEDLWNSPVQELLAVPQFAWEADRIGASAPPIRISPTEWLLSYHGKQDEKTGYTQSFMILEEQPNGFPIVRHRCSDRMILPEKSWEMPGRFKTPVIFITGMIRLGDSLMISYGAADQRVGVASLDYQGVVEAAGPTAEVFTYANLTRKAVNQANLR